LVFFIDLGVGGGFRPALSGITPNFD
jgi:hypothetical protein